MPSTVLRFHSPALTSGKVYFLRCLVRSILGELWEYTLGPQWPVMSHSDASMTRTSPAPLWRHLDYYFAVSDGLFWRSDLGSWDSLFPDDWSRCEFLFLLFLPKMLLTTCTTILETAWAMHQSSFAWRNWENVGHLIHASSFLSLLLRTMSLFMF